MTRNPEDVSAYLARRMAEPVDGYVPPARHPAATRRGHQVALRLTPEPRIAGDCNGEGGYCGVYECREHLSVEILPSGTIRIPASPGRPAFLLPMHRTRDRTVTPEVAALWSEDDDPLLEARMARGDWLVERYGSECWRDVRKVLGEEATQGQLGELWQVTRQCVEQWMRRGEGVVRERLGDGSTDIRSNGYDSLHSHPTGVCSD